MEQTNDFTDLEWAELIMERTTLKPKINLKEAVNFGKYDFHDINQLGDEQGDTIGCIRGFVTDVLNKDKLIRGDLKNHIHKFEQHMIFLNINDGTGNLAVQISPHIYDKYKSFVYDLKGKPIVAFGKFTVDGKKLLAELLEIPGKTFDVKKIYEKPKDSVFIVAAFPAVSKKGKSYYRVELNNGVKGMCFRFKEKLVAGMDVRYRLESPFITLKVIKNLKGGNE